MLVLPIGGNMLKDFENIKNAFAQVPGVEGVTASYETPEFVEWGDGISATDEKGKHDISLNAMPVDLDYLNTLGMQLAAGRDFLPSDFSLMDTSDNYKNFTQPFIINETLAKRIGWTPSQSIGRIISKGASGPIVGVVKDFNFSTLHDPIGPLAIFLGRGYSRNFILRISGNKIQPALAAIESVWKQRVPDRPFTFHFLDEDYNNLYLSEQRSSQLFTLAAGLAILLACLGLFGLAAFTTVQRTKEIGIRRILGANILNITVLIARKFVGLVGIAILVAAPFAWMAGNHWLRDFTFRIMVKPNTFILTACVTILITLITIGYHSIKAAIQNPVKSLRSD